MNRFFSKLDLRDIKIDPQGSHFPPDDDGNAEPPASEEPGEDVAVVPPADEFDGSYESSWDTSPAPDASYDGGAVTAVVDAAPVVVTEPTDGEVARYGEVLKVSSRSRPSAVAGAIAGVVRESGRAEVQAIGAGATNQAVKAVAIARDYLRETGIEAVCLPAFIDVTIDNEDRTAIRLVVEPR
jgi:stage V sporulation protein S